LQTQQTLQNTANKAMAGGAINVPQFTMSYQNAGTDPNALIASHATIAVTGSANRSLDKV
jgi:hypothetical protein